MAIELTESTEPRKRYGGVLPVIALPPLAHRKLAAGDASFQLNAATALVAVLPDTDCRVRVGEKAEADAAGAGDVLLKANVLRHFEVTGGRWMRVVAA